MFAWDFMFIDNQ